MVGVSEPMKKKSERECNKGPKGFCQAFGTLHAIRQKNLGKETGVNVARGASGRGTAYPWETKGAKGGGNPWHSVQEPGVLMWVLAD